MQETIKCDNCGKILKIMPSVNYAIEKEGLIPICKKCQADLGLSRDRFHGQIQGGYYLGNQ